MIKAHFLVKLYELTLLIKVRSGPSTLAAIITLRASYVRLRIFLDSRICSLLLKRISTFLDIFLPFINFYSISSVRYLLESNFFFFKVRMSSLARFFNPFLLPSSSISFEVY